MRLRNVALIILATLVLVLHPAGARAEKENPEGHDGETNTARAVLIYYGGYDEEVYNRIRNIRPALLVTSTPNDYWQSENSLKDIGALQDLGVKVFGFTTASYETMERLPDGRSQEECIRDILEKDKVDGIFVDQSSARLDENKIRYHKKYADIVHSYGKMYYVNPGMNEFDERWFTEIGVDLISCTEHWCVPGYPNTAYRPSDIQSKYASRCTVLSFPLDNVQDAYTAVTRAYAHGIGYAYANDNFYLTIAPFWEELADRLRGDIELPSPGTIAEPSREIVVLDRVDIDEIGWVVLYKTRQNGEPDMSAVVGKMYLYPGTHSDVRIEITGNIRPGETLSPVLHRDAPGDQVFTFAEGENQDSIIRSGEKIPRIVLQ